MLKWLFGKKKARKRPKKKARGKKPSYEEAKVIAASDDVEARRNLALHEDLEPEFLYFFATDKSADVRRAVADNDGTPLQADLILARDVDPGVRQDLAFKVGRLAPTLTADENDRVVEMAFEVLEILANDQLSEVRAIIADEVKHLPNIPKRVINRLAKDAEEIVAGPILEYSPLLSDDQLMQIIIGGLQGGALDAVARRKNLSEDLSEAVAERGQTSAVAELLKNQTALIGEKLMEEIAISAESKPDLHIPLVDRANLSATTMRRIATFVSASLVERLISTNSLTDSIAADLRLAVRSRIDEGSGVDGREKAIGLHEAGRLDGYAILDAIDAEDKDFVYTGMALLAKLDEDLATKMLKSESSKAICALSFKAGLDADIAVSLQRRVGNIPAKSMIHPTSDGDFAMTVDELKWYLEYFDK